MAGSASIIHNLTISGGTAPILGNSLPATVTYASNSLYQTQEAIADNYTAVVLWAANGGLATFQFGVILSDQDVLMELKNNLGSPEYDLLFVPANVPIYFGGTARAGTTQRITSGVQTTGLGNIVQINVQRNVAAAVGGANVQMILFK